MTTLTRDFYSPTECVERLGISPDTWERWIRPALLSGEIINYKVGTRRLVSWSSLMDYLAKYHNGALI